MDKQRNNFKAGLFIVISIALIIGIVIAIKGVGTIFTQVHRHTVRFALADDVGGLAVGDEVRLGGVKVGDVESIAFEGTGEPSIVVTFTVPSRFQLKRDARVAIQTTIMGSAWLNIDRLGAGAALSDGEALAGTTGGLTQLFATAGELAPELKGLLADVRTQTLPKVNSAVDGFQQTGPAATRLLGKVESQVDPAVAKYHALTDAGTDALANIRDIAGDSKADFRSTVANLSAVTGSAKEKLPPILEKIDAVAARAITTVEGAQAAVVDLQTSLSNTKDLTSAARSLVIRNRGKIDTLATSLKTTGDNLKAASAEIRHSPWRLLYKPGPNEVANLNLYDATRQFADGAGALNDAAASLRDALDDPETKPEQVQKLMDQLDATFSQFQTVEQKLWNSVKQ